MELKATFRLITTNKKISDLQKLILLWVSMTTENDIYCDSSNKEFAKLLNKHHITISKAIANLIDQELLIQTTIDAKRVLRLIEIANPLIIKNNKINNSYLSFNKNKKISIKDCEEVAIKLVNHFLKWDSNTISNCLIERVINHRKLKAVKTVKQFGVIIHSILKGGIKDEILHEALEFDYDLSLANIQNAIRKICGYEPLEVTCRIDEGELRRQEYERQLRKHIRTGYQERIIDISKNPAQLQQPFKNQKLVTIEGEVVEAYEAGEPPFCNITLKVSNYDQFVYASIKSNHYKDLKVELDGYNGLIKITGEVGISKYHKKEYGIQNKIKSVDELKPIEFLDRSNLLNTKLM